MDLSKFEVSDPSFWVNKMDAMRQGSDPNKHFRERQSNGFSTYDWWNFCDYIAWVNIQALERLKTGAGYPADMAGMDEWIVLLDKMIDGFKAHLVLSEMKYETPEEARKLDKIREEGLKIYAERFPSLWD